MSRGFLALLAIAAGCGGDGDGGGPAVGPVEGGGGGEPGPDGGNGGDPGLPEDDRGPLGDPAYVIEVDAPELDAGEERQTVHRETFGHDQTLLVEAFEMVADDGLHHSRLFFDTDEGCENGSHPDQRNLYATSTGVSTDLYRLPPDVVIEIPPEVVLCLDWHFIALEATRPSIHVNVYTVEPREGLRRASVFSLEDVALAIPPSASEEQPHMEAMDCFWPEELWVTVVVPHMHFHGLTQSVRRLGAGGADLGLLWRWDDVYDSPPHVFSPPEHFAAGEGVRIECAYFNSLGETIGFGSEARTTEMCILYGYLFGPGVEYNGGTMQEGMDCLVGSR